MFLNLVEKNIFYEYLLIVILLLKICKIKERKEMEFAEEFFPLAISGRDWLKT